MERMKQRLTGLALVAAPVTFVIVEAAGWRTPDRMSRAGWRVSMAPATPRPFPLRTPSPMNEMSASAPPCPRKRRTDGRATTLADGHCCIGGGGLGSGEDSELLMGHHRPFSVLVMVLQLADRSVPTPSNPTAKLNATVPSKVARADSWGDTDFCHVKPAPVDPESLVLWEGDWLLAPWWDDALEANPSWYPRNAIWYQMDRAAGPIWHIMLGDPARVDGTRQAVGDPFGSGDECDREIPPGEPGGTGGLCRSYDLRDPSQALRREADRLGQFDDGWWNLGEWSLLLADQLAANRVAQTTTVIPGATHGDLTLDGFQAFVDLVLQDPPTSPTTTSSTTTTATTAPPTTTTVAASPQSLSPTFTG